MGIRCFIACFLLLFVNRPHCAAQQMAPGAYTNGFTPATNTIFSDDFTRYKNYGPFESKKWSNNAGAKIVADLDGRNILLFQDEMRTLIPVISDKSIKGKYVTFECDFMFLKDDKTTLILNFPDEHEYGHYFTIDRNYLVQYVRGDNTSGGDYSIPIKGHYPGMFYPMQWHCLSISFSARYLKVYLDNYQIWGLGNSYREWAEEWGADTSILKDATLYNGYKPATFVITNKSSIALRHVRFAQSDTIPNGNKVQPAQFNKILTGEKFVTHDILFDVNKAAIKSESEEYLLALAAWLKQNRTIKLEIAGHTDSDGDETANMLLSQKRADAIVNKLVSSGVAAARLKGVGYGESKPVKPNDTEAGKAANRRVEFQKM